MNSSFRSRSISFGWSDYMKLSLCENMGYILIFIGYKNKQNTKIQKLQRKKGVP